MCIDCSFHLYTDAAIDRNGRAAEAIVSWTEIVLCRCGHLLQSERRTWIPKRADRRWVSAIVKPCAHCGLQVLIAWFVGGAERQRCAGIRYSDPLPAWRERLRRLLLQRSGVDA